ncbi:hypothetical protein ACQPW1_39425 [Nocardia sp. CA-128927]|uniref:hypothetical protein n=1 Tax=Nocardia sp. CA-128927 TaxID=3239975 RepID=UPI003D96BDE4
MTVHAYAIVRLDYSGPQADVHVAGLETLAASHGVELAAGGVLLAQSDSSFSRLLAGLDFEAVDVVMVPSAAQIKGWLGVLRHSAEVWTALPPQRWPRCRAIPRQTAESVPRPM